MRAGPVRRLIATIGLIALAPIGYLLLTGELTMEAAGQRAAITLGAVIVASRIGGWAFNAMAASMEGPQVGQPVPQRRATDQVPTAE